MITADMLRAGLGRPVALTLIGLGFLGSFITVAIGFLGLAFSLLAGLVAHRIAAGLLGAIVDRKALIRIDEKRSLFTPNLIPTLLAIRLIFARGTAPAAAPN